MVDFESAQYEYERKLISIGEANQNDPAEIIHARLLEGEIVGALRALPEEYPSTLLLVDIEECTYEEAAKALGCPARNGYSSKHSETMPRRRDY